MPLIPVTSCSHRGDFVGLSARFIADLHYNDGLTVAVVISVISSVRRLVLQLTYITTTD